MKRIAVVLLVLAAVVRADALAHLKQALAKLDALELEEAEKSLDKAIAEKPDLAAAYVARAALRAERENAQGAAEDALRACELGEDLWKWATELATRATDYTRTGKAAEGAFAKYGDVESLQTASESWASAGEFRKAIELYGRLIEKSDGAMRLEARMKRGNLLSLAGDHKAGLAELDDLLAKAPRYVRAYQLRGRVKLRLGDATGALADYRRAQEINSGEASAYLILGLAHYDTGDYKQAVVSLERATAFSSYHRYVQLYLFLARVRAGTDAGEARTKLKKFLDGRSEKEDWFAALGGFLAGDVTEEGLLKSARVGPADVQREQMCEAWSYVGQMALIAGEKDKAVECFKKSIATKVGSFMEYGTAAMELRRLEKDEG